MNVEIAQRLAQLRREKGYSQEELAEKLGLSRQAVSKWERAESSPDTDNLIALARLYNTSLDKLLAIEPIIEDDISYETHDRARMREEQQAQVESIAQAAEAAEESNAAAAQIAREAAEAAAQAARAASEAAQATAQATQATQAAAQSAQSAQGAQTPYATHGTQAPQTPYATQGAQAAWSPQTPVYSKPPKTKSALRYFPYPLLVVVVYLFLGFFFFLWHPGWILFLSIPFYYWIVGIVERDLNKGDRS